MTTSLLAGHDVVAIDSNVLIYLLEGSAALADTAGALLDAIAAGEAGGVMSALGIAEVAAGPARFGDEALVHRFRDELTSLENVRVLPVDVDVATEAALIRAAGPLTLADAIHLATARLGGATAYVTNDRGIASIDGIEVRYLDDLADA